MTTADSGGRYRSDRFVADSSEFHTLECSLMRSRQRLKAEGREWPDILAQQEPCDCGAVDLPPNEQVEG